MAKRNFQNLLVTGGSGFIGSNFIKYLFTRKEFSGRVINLDKLTYAGNPENLSIIEERYGGKQYFFEKGDICDQRKIRSVVDTYAIDCIVHFAAESHVDRSIYGPQEFILTNILGTFNLLECCRSSAQKGRPIHFHHISTDEVFGSLGESGYFYEETPYDPRSPYSASKASSDHLVSAYHHTYGLPVTLSNCSNNYGPYQFPEKLIPLMIMNAIEGKPLPVYGDGMNIRDWLYVEEHCSAIWLVLIEGRSGTTYNVGGENEAANITVVTQICEILEELYPITRNTILKESGKTIHAYTDLITYVKDRPGHDRRYAINCDKIKRELGWAPNLNFRQGLTRTIKWYLKNPQWVDHIRTGEYKNWIERNYTTR